MIVVHRSNAIGPLLEELLAEIAAHPPAPLAPETIVVDSALHARWVGERLADHFGVWGNPHFPFLRGFLDALATAVLGPAPTERYDGIELPWHVARALLTLLERERGDERLAPVRAFLGTPRDDLRLVDLARLLAETFDRYFVYRPQWILDWERGRGVDDWQAELMAQLTATLGPYHLPARLSALVKHLDHHEITAELPPRLHLFAASHLPPLLLDVLGALGRRTHVHLYVITPTRQFLGGIGRHDREVPRLLAASARRFADMQQLLEGLGRYAETDRDLFVLAPQPTLLQALRNGLVDLEAAPLPADRPRPDPSIELHVCHGPLREVEVATDRLRAALADPTLRGLRSDQIAIVTPDLPRYAPLCAAVLAEARLPFQIVGRTGHRRTATQGALLQILDLARGRLRVDDLLVLFDSPPVRARLGMDDRDRATVARWLETTYTRWGIDGAHRQRLGSESSPAGTFRFALDRLVAGYVTSAPLDPPLPLPVADMAVSDGPLLGGVGAYLATLFEFVEAAAAPHAPAQWLRRLADLVRDLLGDLDSEPAARWELEQALRRRAAVLAATAPPVSVPLAGLLSLAGDLLEPTGGVGLPDTGAILVTDLASYGALPRRVVIALGLADTEFPRGEPRAGFDRMPDEPRRGDPSRRDDDRARFVQLVLGAQERLVLIYAGRSQHDDSVRGPSVVIEELIETLQPIAGPDIARELTVEHPLQPFSSRAFDAAGDLRQRSFQAAFVPPTPGEAPAPHPFFTTPLPPPAPFDLTLDELAELLYAPLAALARRRLAIALARRRGGGDEEPALWLDNLEGYRLKDELLAELLRGTPEAEAVARLYRTGVIGDDSLGRAELNQRLPVIRELAGAVRAVEAGRAPRRHPVEQEGGLARLVDRVAAWDEGGQVAVLHHRAGQPRASDLLKLWVHHLGYASDDGRARLPSRLVTAGGQLALAPIDATVARDRLAAMLALAAQALTVPLLLLPDASALLVDKLRDGDLDRARSAVKKLWSERPDPYYTLFFGDALPWEVAPLAAAPTFEALAESLYGPLAAARVQP